MARFASLMAAAALVGSAAAAQYYPQYPQPYPQPYGQPAPAYPYNYPGQPYPGQPYPGQPYGNDQSAVGAIIDGLIGNRYNVSDRQAIRQCAFAAVQRSQAYGGGYGGYGGYGRVTAITDVERRTFGVRVRGVMASGRYGNGYGGGYGRADLGFRCDVDYRGYVRNVRLDPLVRRY